MTEHNSAFTRNIFESKRREIYWQLKEIGLEEQECHAEAALILERVSGMNQTEQLIKDVAEFPSKWLEEITRIINLRRERRPLAYCLDEVEFSGLFYRIIPGVLIPRTDTETLIECVIEWAENETRIRAQVGTEGEAINKVPHLSIAEIGIGSGIIAISLLKRLPNCTVWACDISEAAIATALGNARRHGVHERLTIIHGDWRSVLPDNFDAIVSNPPYVSSLHNPKRIKNKDKSTIKLQPELYFEPEDALFAGEDGLDFYRHFARILPKHYNFNEDKKEKNLLGAFEIGDEQEESVLKIFAENGWQKLKCIKDMNGLPRVVSGEPQVVSKKIQEVPQ